MAKKGEQGNWRITIFVMLEIIRKAWVKQPNQQADLQKD